MHQVEDNWLVVSNYFYFHSYLWEMIQFDNVTKYIFQVGGSTTNCDNICTKRKFYSAATFQTFELQRFEKHMNFKPPEDREEWVITCTWPQQDLVVY